MTTVNYVPSNVEPVLEKPLVILVVKDSSNSLNSHNSTITKIYVLTGVLKDITKSLTLVENLNVNIVTKTV